jgi:hypothetical protein
MATERTSRRVSLLSGLNAADPPVPRAERRVAAPRTRMLKLSAERSRVARQDFVRVERTRGARSRWRL